MKNSMDGLHWRIGAAEERGAEKSVCEFEKKMNGIYPVLRTQKKRVKINE